MLMPEPVFQLVRAFAARFPVPTGFPGEAHDEACRAWTTQLCQQVAWSVPDQGYGAKRADPGRPLSKDVLAQQTATGLIGWDVLIGAGTGRPAVIGAPGESLDLTGQAFVEVLGINWLGAPAPGPGPEPDPEPPGRVCQECAMVLDRLDVLVDAVLHHNVLLQTLVDQVASVVRVPADGGARVATQVDTRVKIGW